MSNIKCENINLIQIKTFTNLRECNILACLNMYYSKYLVN